MLVEAAIHERPIVSICIDQPGGWNRPDKFSLSLKDIGKWPTHDRFRTVHAGAVAFNTSELKDALNNAFLDDPSEKINRLRFIENEVTCLDGKSGERVADIILNCIGRNLRKARFDENINCWLWIHRQTAFSQFISDGANRYPLFAQSQKHFGNRGIKRICG